MWYVRMKIGALIGLGLWLLVGGEAGAILGAIAAWIISGMLRRPLADY